MACRIDDSAVVVLAAGVSGRMGFPKPLLKFNDDECFLERIIHQYMLADIGDIVVVASALLYDVLIRRDFPFLREIRLVLNAEPELGRFHSVIMGLRETGEGKFCYIQNVDQPFTDVALIKALAARAHAEAFVSPVYKGEEGHPILLGRAVVKDILEQGQSQMVLREFLRPYKKVPLPSENANICINLNTVADFKSYFGREPEVV
jgi:molybdenum cofactor cytidylyltransferase